MLMTVYVVVFRWKKLFDFILRINKFLTKPCKYCLITVSIGYLVVNDSYPLPYPSGSVSDALVSPPFILYLACRMAVRRPRASSSWRSMRNTSERALISCAMPPTMRRFSTKLRSSSCWIACCAARTRLSVARFTALPAAYTTHMLVQNTFWRNRWESLSFQNHRNIQ